MLRNNERFSRYSRFPFLFFHPVPALQYLSLVMYGKLVFVIVDIIGIFIPDKSKRNVHKDYTEHLKNIKLADPQWFKPSQIDLLLGVDFIPYIMQAGKILGSLNEPFAFNTIFGYVIMGQCNTLTQSYT